MILGCRPIIFRVASIGQVSHSSRKSKKPWDRSENGYPLRSHDCMPNETEFAETFQDAQEDLERKESKQAANHDDVEKCA